MANSDIAISLPRTTVLSGSGYKYGLRGHPAFCAVCTNFNREVALELHGIIEPGRIYLIDYWNPVLVISSFQEIAEAANGGCSSCLLLHECVVAFRGPEILKHAEDLELWITYWTGKCLTLRFGYGAWNDAIELFTDEGAYCPWPAIGPDIWFADPIKASWPLAGGVATRVPLDPSSSECYQTIRTWLQKCEQDHPWCDIHYPLPARNLQAAVKYPKRLIYIGDSHFDVRLCEIGDLRPTYAALSYCWGSKRGLVSQRANIQGLMVSIPTELLNGTRGDAIDVVRRIGLQYLWIDSLCIVQDDANDWALESANMASIYANAHVCISASAASDSDMGFLHWRTPTKTIVLTDVSGKTSRIFARTSLPHSVYGWDDQLTVNLQPAGLIDPAQLPPLFTRGWAFQERLLSPRILHYTQHELIWECLGSMSCECGAMHEHVISSIFRERQLLAAVRPDVEIRCNSLTRSRKLAEKYGMLNTRLTARQLSTFIINDPALMLAILGEEAGYEIHKESLSERWHTLVRNYSERALTYSTDVLPALSGLASRWALRQPFESKYLAGLWEHSLLGDLMWRCPGAETIPRPQQYLAPSWSWASIRRPVEFMTSNHPPLYHTHVEEAACDTSATNLFGPVTGGHVKLRGPTTEGRICSSLPSGAVFVQLSAENHPKQECFFADCIPECAQLVGTTVLMLWLCTAVNDQRTRRGFERALVLIDKDSHQPLAGFRRIGLMGYNDDVDNIPWQERIIIII